jgi:hypothetical protein
MAGPSCCPDHSSNSKRDFKRRASQSCDSVLNEVRPTGKISLKNSTTASVGTKAPTLQRRYTHPVTKIDLKEPDVIRRRLSHISPSDSAIANASQRYNGLYCCQKCHCNGRYYERIHVIDQSCLQPLFSTYAAGSRTEHKEILPYTKAAALPR